MSSHELHERLVEGAPMLTQKELNAVIACIRGELENDDGMADPYMSALSRAVQKLSQRF